jgi:hypothetical protein
MYRVAIGNIKKRVSDLEDKANTGNVHKQVSH